MACSGSMMITDEEEKETQHQHESIGPREKKLEIESHVQQQRDDMHMKGRKTMECTDEIWEPWSNQPGGKSIVIIDSQFYENESKRQNNYQPKEKKIISFEKQSNEKRHVSARKNQFKSSQQYQNFKRRGDLYQRGRHHEMIQYACEGKKDKEFDWKSKHLKHKRKVAHSRSTILNSQDGGRDVGNDKQKNCPQQEKRKDCFHFNRDCCVDNSRSNYGGLKTVYHYEKTSPQDVMHDKNIWTGNQSNFLRELGEEHSVPQVDDQFTSSSDSKKQVFVSCSKSDLTVGNQPSQNKPLKSILKKKQSKTFENMSTDSGCDKVTWKSTQETDYIAKPFDESYSFCRTVLQKEEGNMKLSLQPELNFDDEEEFLYGQRKVDTKLSTGMSKSLIDTLYDSNEKKGSIVKVSGETPSSPAVSNMPSWMKPLVEVTDIEEREEKDSLDQTVEEILKSIGFNFDLSKRMQELAKIKNKNEEELHFSINKSASFLGSAIPGISFSGKLNKKDDTQEETTSIFSKGVVGESVPGNILHHEGIDKTCSQNWFPQNYLLKGLQNSRRNACTSNNLKGTFEEFLSNDEANVKKQQACRSEVILPDLAHSCQPCYATPLEPKNENPEIDMPKWFTSSFTSSNEFSSDKQTVKSSPLSEDTDMITKLEVFEEKSSRKRQREESPEYSGIVHAPMIRAKQTEIPCKRNREVKHKMTERKEKQSESKNSMKNQKQILKEIEERKKKLIVLERELSKLEKHQNEIMRRRQRQKDGHKDPLLLENSKLQEEISAQIQLLKRPTDVKDMSAVYADFTETAKIIPGETSSKWKPFSDPGNHWCFDCNHVSETLFDHLRHLQSRIHQQLKEKYNKEWTGKLQQKMSLLQKNGTEETTLIKGVEFLSSTNAFHCSLCDVFTGDMHSAEAHLTSQQHIEEYTKYTEQNEFYEKRYALEKTAALSRKKKQSVTRKLPIDEEQVSETVRESCPLQEQVLPVQDGHGSIPSSEVLIDHENNMSLKNLPQKSLSEHNSEKVAVKYMQTKKIETKEKVEVKTIENSKHEEIAKGKIAIKLTGKTVIKPHDKILPVWTPLATKFEVTLPKKFKEVKTSVMSVAKPEISNPPSLDSFLSIGGLATKKLPVYKLRPGVFRKPLHLSSDPVVSYDTHETTAHEEEADMKLLGIDSDMTNEIALKRKPPPRSQNVSLPKHISSKSSSSAEQLYSVFFQDGGHVNERSCQLVDLDDIPIPPPPPLPPSSICHATTSNTSESLHTKGKKGEAGDCVAKLEENISNMKDRKEKDNTFINMANLLQFCPRMPPDMTELGDKKTEKDIDEERNEGNKSLTINDDVSLRREGWLLPEQMTLHETETEDEEIIYVESDFEVVDEYTAE